MDRDAQQSHLFCSELSQNTTTITDSINRIKHFAFQEFDREIVSKKLCYHTHEHIYQVQRRTDLIFQAVYPTWNGLEQQPRDLARMKLLLDLAVAAHDMVQVFAPQPRPHAARKRESGVSEMVTIERLFQYIHALNEQLQYCHPDSPARLTEADLQTIREAIAATICVYDPTEHAIYQPKLSDPELSIAARILALADIGALGIDGIETYNQEGSLLFLEENPDVIPLLLDKTIDALKSENPALYQNIQQRLLQRCRFQVSFAKSRLARLQQELRGFPEAAIPVLTHEVFRYLNQETIQAVEAITPTENDSSLVVLLQFFQFERYLA